MALPILAAVGHGAVREGQIINRMLEMYEADHKKMVSDDEIMAEIESNNGLPKMQKKNNGGIVVKGIHDVAVRFSKCCSPVPGDEIVGFVTRGRGVSIHRTDCVNVINLPDFDRARLIDAEWQEPEGEKGQERYLTEISIFANNRHGLLADVSRTLTEKNIDILSVNTRTNRNGVATMCVSFEISGREELQKLVEKLRNIDSVIDIERTKGG